ncbi:ATP-binding protein [Leifsonia sp. AG29]|uniref:ATP-binding protein n=1 Tax=Leifsonia sp. AG29 TaxID=2598860 RepID=UPI00131D30DD|nr:ATP-binding protein [Leifsonia sp. AG29]
MRRSADSAEPAAWTAGLDVLERTVGRAVMEARTRNRLPIILIDGPSGAGKSSLADHLLASWSAPGEPRLVRMDDLYPGWDGLDAGSVALGAELLVPLRATGSGRWRRWDWAADRPGEWETVRGSEPLIVEGCGTLSRPNAELADLGIWLDADDELRRARAIARDGETFAAHWDQWQDEFERYLARENPRENADVVVDITAWPFGTLANQPTGTNVEA